MMSGSCHMVEKHLKDFIVLFLAAFGSISASGCRVDFSPGDPFCSNGVKEEGEMCDGNDLGGETCVTQGYDSGDLACLDDCSGFDTSGCGRCGDGAINGHEVCDGVDLGGETCATQGYDSGDLACLDDCSGLDTSECGHCGDGAINGHEVCDGVDLDGETCMTQGYDSGYLACLDDCSGFDTSGCGRCGDDQINGHEVCDGNDLGGETCLTQGYDGGVLACNDDCSGLDVSGCYEKPPIEWIHVSGGSFFMGSSDSDLDERPVHLVNVPSFEMMKTEVTVEFYSTCVIAGACETPGTGVNCNWGRSGFEDHPLNCVTWFQAVDFCDWVAGRLPSEAEWEYAARSNGQDIVYPWGNQTATCDYAVMNDGGAGCGTESTWPVCSKPNGNTATGLCDMAGNVWEWVLDWYHQNYEGAPGDGSAWLDPEGTERVFRGGGIWSDHDRVRAAKRHRYGPSVQIVDLGFRCAR